MIRPRSLLVPVPLALAAAALLAAGTGCDDPFIDPYVNPGRIYTVWGYVDPAAATQTVRVVPVTRLPAAEREPTVDDLDARVFSTEVWTGFRVEWRHDVVELEDGSWAHVFSTGAHFRAGYLYRLEVVRSDGKKATAETLVPDYDASRSVERGPVREDPDGHLRQEITLRGIPSPWGLRVTYRVENPAARLITSVDYGEAGSRAGPSDWIIDVDLTADRSAVKEDVLRAIREGEVQGEAGLDAGFSLAEMGVRFTVADGAWDLPERPVDPERFARPDAVTNVTGGYGFWGSVTFYEDRWSVTSELSLAFDLD